MSRKTVSELKAYFETGDVPSQSEFGDLIDSTFNATSGLNSTNGFATLSVMSLSVSELFADSLQGVSQSLAVTTPTGTSTLTITDGIITNIS